MTEKLREQLLGLINDPHYNPLKREELALIFNIHPSEMPMFYNFLDELEEDGYIVKTKKGRVMSPNQMGLFVGKFVSHRKGFGFVGFLDDFIKIKMKRSLGLKAYQKIILQFALALFVSYYQYSASPSATQIMIPFTDYIINLGPLYVPIMMFVIIGTVNAVNLTDGLDGLASGITLIVSIFFMLLAISVGNSDVAILAAATGGACLGFLGFNSYPAKVFMGDTGSMALGGAVVSFAVLTNSVLLIPIVGGIYFAEAISVIIQVTSFRLTGKRVFKMAPIHHHFEQCGWPETRVVFVFWIATVVLAWIGIIAVF